jgi:hypothetical protein
MYSSWLLNLTKFITLQGLLVAHELRERLLPADVYRVRPTVLKVLEALTGKAAKEIMDCERFEFLGDAVLKFVVAQELYQQSGAIRADQTLGFELDRCVSNGSLFRAAFVCSFVDHPDVHRNARPFCAPANCSAHMHVP